MKKTAFILSSVFLTAVVGLSIWFYFTDPDTPLRKHPEYQILKNHFDAYRDSINQMDFKIARAPEPYLDSLIKTQRLYMEEYEQLRADIVHFTTNATGWKWLYNVRKSLAGNPLMLLIMAIGSFLLVILFGVAYRLKTKKGQPNHSKMETLAALERSIEQLKKIAPPEKKRNRTPEPPAGKSHATTRLNQDLSHTKPRVKSPNILVMEEEEEGEDEKPKENESHKGQNKPTGTREEKNFLKPPSTKPGSESIQPEDTSQATKMNRISGFDVPDTPSGRWRAFVMEERVRDDIIRLERRGMTPSEISRRLRISQDQVEILLRMHKNSSD